MGTWRLSSLRYSHNKVYISRGREQEEETRVQVIIAPVSSRKYKDLSFLITHIIQPPRPADPVHFHKNDAKNFRKEMEHSSLFKNTCMHLESKHSLHVKDENMKFTRGKYGNKLNGHFLVLGPLGNRSEVVSRLLCPNFHSS
ncbi:uncharacterized protein LOC114527643 [Dendronephthya gigantea]|uniref:uncharacterized protein LOC114527643 n=1 Tax=Dendronephthya gigantea TaxID=151771 RepID=UPI00106CC9E5|nr:uncharacterized protein LOC114527643 [Dendronephthya gigantea]